MKVSNNPEKCTDFSQTVTTGAPNSPIAKAEARIEGEKVKGWVNSVVLALSVGVNIVLFLMYLDSQRDVADAYKDIKTQVWVKQDKAEARYLEFLSGPYAQLAGQSKANGDEIQSLRRQIEQLQQRKSK